MIPVTITQDVLPHAWKFDQIKVHSSGVCHSGIHLCEGGDEGIEGQFLKASDRGVSYPPITTGPFTLSLYWVVMLKGFVKAFTSRTRFIIIGSNYLEKKELCNSL